MVFSIFSKNYGLSRYCVLTAILMVFFMWIFPYLNLKNDKFEQYFEISNDFGWGSHEHKSYIAH